MDSENHPGGGGCLSGGKGSEEDLEKLLEAAHPEEYLRPVDTLFAQFPAVKLTPNQEKRCRNGNAFSVSYAPGRYRAYSQRGEFLMLAQVSGGSMTTVKSFFEPDEES